MGLDHLRAGERPGPRAESRSATVSRVTSTPTGSVARRYSWTRRGGSGASWTRKPSADLDRFAGERAAEVAELLAEPLADEMSRGTALRFGALLHDIGKPATRPSTTASSASAATTASAAEIVGEICGRLRASRAPHPAPAGR